LNCIAVCSFQIPNRNCNADERLQYAKGRATCGMPWSMTTPRFRKVIESDLVDFAGLDILDDDALDAGIGRGDEHAEVDGPRIERTVEMLRALALEPQDRPVERADDSAITATSRTLGPVLHGRPPLLFCC
jgi:hypothetical protein